MATTYCVKSDLESIIGEAAVRSASDDSRTAVGDDTLVTSAIERAAVEMNGSLRVQYPTLSALTSNDWCKWCNAYLGCLYLLARRNNKTPASVVEECNTYRAQLEDIRWGRWSIPEQLPQGDHRASVSNFTVELNKIANKVRVDEDESTGDTPGSNIKRNPANQPGPY
jgi:hypothetical protein